MLPPQGELNRPPLSRLRYQRRRYLRPGIGSATRLGAPEPIGPGNGEPGRL